MVKLKNSFFMSSGLTHLQELKKMKELSYKDRFRVALLLKDMENSAKAFEETRLGLFDEYGEDLEDGKKKIKEECLEAYYKDLNELLDMEMDFEFNKLKLPESEAFSPELIVALWDLIEIPKDL